MLMKIMCEANSAALMDSAAQTHNVFAKLNA